MKRREAILIRLNGIIDAVPGVKSTWRNRAAVPDDARPALYLLDGDETNPHAEQGTNRGRGPMKGHTYYLDLLPQIHVAMDERQTENNVGIGSDLNDLLAHLQYRISNDDDLIGLVTNNGDIVYLGLQSDLGVGRTMLGQYQTNWRLRYPVNMEQLSID